EASHLRDPQEDSQRPIDAQHSAFIDPADHTTDLPSTDRMDLVDHDLRRQPKPGTRLGRKVEAEGRRLPHVAADRKDGHRRMLVEHVRLYDKSRTRLSVVSRERPADYVAALRCHPSVSATCLIQSRTCSSCRSPRTERD